jgi:hypothetical protein
MSQPVRTPTRREGSIKSPGKKDNVKINFQQIFTNNNLI